MFAIFDPLRRLGLLGVLGLFHLLGLFLLLSLGFSLGIPVMLSPLVFSLRLLTAFPTGFTLCFQIESRRRRRI